MKFNAKNNNSPSISEFYAGQLLPGQQVTFCQNIDQYFPTRKITCGHTRYSLKESPASVENLHFESEQETTDLFDYISRNRVAGLLILKHGDIVLENYEYGCDRNTRWMSMSMAKSISTTLVGAAIQDNYINHIDDLLVAYLPQLKGGSYEDVSVRQLLLMSSGVAWNEDSTDIHSQRAEVLRLQIAQKPGSILNYMSSLPKLAPAGQRWNYSTGETHIVGELLKAATGKWLADYLSEKIWGPLGMESNATWWLESADGLEVAGSGISATLRDYGRFGLFIQNGGKIGGKSILPDDWFTHIAGPTCIGNNMIPYGYMWWSVPDKDHKYTDKAFAARGIFGQRMYINPRSELVIVVLAARSKPIGDEGVIDNDFFNAVNRFLSIQ